VLDKKSQRIVFPLGDLNRWQFGGVTLAVATGIAYFLAARLGQVLHVEPGLAIFWPASGISVGVLIALGPRVRVPVAAAVLVGSTVCGLTIGRSAWLSIAFGFLNALQTLLTAWLLEQWFGRTFKLEDVRSVLGFFAATAVGSAIAAAGAVVTISFVNSIVSPLYVWGLWFAASTVGVATVAPLLIGLNDAMRERLPRHELMEGWAAIIALTALTFFLISLPDGPWGTALPEGLVFPFLLWVAIRCRPVFAAGTALVVGLTVIGTTALNVGNFDWHKPLADRILSAQTFVFIESILVVLLAAVFAERRRSEQATKQVAKRLQLALDGAALGAFSADLATGQLACDCRAAQFHGHSVLPTTIEESRCFVHRDDLKRIDSAIAEAQHTRGNWKAEYRVIPPPGHPHAGETRWVAVEGSIVRDAHGAFMQLFGVTRDITHHKRAEKVLAERNAQLALAGRAALVGSYGYDIRDGKMQVSQGYAAIHGLPAGTTETTRREWRDRVHPNDVGRLDGFRGQAFGDRRREYNVEYRIVLPNRGVRWIESRSFISYDGDGNAERVIGVNIDVTERKLTDLALAERNTQLELASKTARIGSFSIDFSTGVVKLTSGCAAIFGLPQGTAEMSRTLGRELVHPEDLPQLELRRDQAFLAQQHEFIAQFRIIRADDREIRWIETRNLIFYDQSAKPSQLIGAGIDFTERKLAEDIVAERNLQLELAGRAGRVGCFAYDLSTEIMQISQGYAAIHAFPEGTVEIARSRCLATVHPDDIGRVERLRIEAFRERRHEYNLEYRIIHPGGEVRWVETRCFISYSSEGCAQRVIGVSIDITERRRAEEGQRILVAELDHRVKNALATVSAVISHTRQGARTIDGFADALEGRIRSMAITQELLSSRQWQGLSLAELVRREIAPYATQNNTEIDGPDVTLRAEAGQALAMVLHELATNAAKYGALSAKHGCVSVRWEQLSGQSRSYLVLDWRETGGPAVFPRGNSGYGTSTIRDLLAYEFGARVDLVFAPEGVQCRLELPDNWLSDDADPISGSSQVAGTFAPTTEVDEVRQWPGSGS
jgi:PAS domain S-box-containing protein